MNTKNENKWRQNYYREMEKRVRYYEFINQNAEVKVHKITNAEKNAYEARLSNESNPFKLKRRTKNEK